MQKVTFLLIGFMALFSLFLSPTVSAQVCNPDTTYTTGGFYPSNLPAGCVGQLYSEVITIVVPVDTTVMVPPFGPVTVPIDSIVIVNVKNIAPGVGYQCEPISCSFPGGTSNCALVSGIPTMIYSDSVEVVFDVYVTLPIVGQQIARDSSNLFEMNIFDTPVATVAGMDAACGATNGSATATVTGTGPFSYSWSNGDTTANITNLAPGIYTVVVANSGGCSDTVSVNIGSVGGPMITGDTTVAADCFGSSAGSISLGISGGTNPLNFSWSNGATTQNLTGLAAGTYTLTVTDANNCVLTYTTTVTQPTAVNAGSPVIGPILCNGDANGSISLSPSGGTSPYGFTWNTTPAQTSSMATNLTAGTYTCLVNDMNGCLDTAMVTLTEPSALMSTTSSDSSLVGMPTGKAWVTPSGGTPPYTYNWNTGEVSDTIAGKPAGTYFAIVTDANGCTVMDTAIIDNLLGLDEDLAAGIASLEAFPNPTTGSLSVRIDLNERDEISLLVSDLWGRSMLRKSKTFARHHEIQVELGHLPAGMYLLQVKTSAGMTSRRIVKE